METRHVRQRDDAGAIPGPARAPRVPAAGANLPRTPPSPAWTPTTSCAPKRRATTRVSGRAWRARTSTGTSRSPGRSTSPTRRSTSGSTTASSMPRTTASTATSRTATPTRPRSSSRPTTATSTASPTASCTSASASSPTALKSRGIKKGDRVIIYMPMSIEGVSRDAGLRAHRRHALGGVRRLLRQDAAGAHHRRRRGGGHHRRRAVARRQDAAAQSHRRRSARRWAAATRSSDVIVYKRTGGDVAFKEGRDLWLHELVDRPVGRLRAGMGRRRASAVHPLHLRLDRHAEGRAALDRRLPAVGRADDEVDLRPQARRRVLVHRRHRLGHRPHLHRLRPAGRRRHRDRVRRRADLPERRPLLEDDRKAQGQHLLHGADGDPLADQGVGRGRESPSEELRPVEPAPAGLGRRADQSGSLDVVLQERRRRTLPDRRHLLADRNRRPHDHAAAGRDADGAGFVHAAAAGHHGRDRRRSRRTTCRTGRAASWSSSAHGRR